MLIGLTGMLRDILKEILAEPDIRIAGEFGRSTGVRAQIAVLEPHMTVTAGNGQVVRRACRELLVEQARMRVLTISDHGRVGSVYELRSHVIDLGEVSAQALLDAVRAARTPPF